MKGAAEVYWLVQSLADVPSGNDAEWLAGPELAKLEGMKFLKRRADWRTGRWTAKRAVCLFAAHAGRELEPRRVEVVARKDGAPEIRIDGENAEVSISISHSAGLAFCAVMSGRERLGCDLETIEARSERFVSDYFTRSEARIVRRAAKPDRPMLATLIWSAKESALKAMRVGLDRDTRSVEVSLDTLESMEAWSPFSVRCREPDQTFFGWWRREGDRLFSCTVEPRTAPPIALL